MFATSAQTSQGTDLRSSGRSDLVDVVRAQDRVVRQRAAAVQQLQDQVESLTAQAAPGSAEVARLRAEAARLAPTVGTQAVTGPSLSVSLDDAHRTAASLPDRSEPVCADTAGSDLQDRLAAALAHLGASQRTIVVLRYWESRSEAEVAQMLNVSRGTVKSQGSRGLARLRELLAADDLRVPSKGEQT